MVEKPIQCCLCGLTKPADEFNWRRKQSGQRDTYCRPCRADYKHRHYTANRQRYIDQAAARRRALRTERTKYLLGYFQRHPCVDCGEGNPVVLEFDHLRDKTFAIGSQLDRYTWGRILEEIAKCEVVCANCHRIRTAKRRGAMRALMVDEAA